MAKILKFVRNTINHWYIPVILGFIFIATSILMFAKPNATFAWLTILFSVSFLIAGIGEIILSLSNRNELKNWGWTLAFGIFSSILGILLLMNLDRAEVIFPFYVGFWVLFRSVGAISMSLDLKEYGILDWGNVMILGILGIIFSIILLWNPVFAGFSIIFWSGIAVLMIGIINVYFGFRLRSIKRLPKRISKEVQHSIDELKSNIQKEIRDFGKKKDS